MLDGIEQYLSFEPQRLSRSDGEAEAFLAEQIARVLADYLPLWRRLGCLA